MRIPDATDAAGLAAASRAAQRRSAGVFFALAAYTSWGVLPIYWKLLSVLPARELLMHRVLGTALFACLLVGFARRWDEVGRVLRDRRRLGALALSSLLIASNWLVFIWAVETDRILAASLGYYLNPLVNVALGVVVLRESLRPLQLVAISIAAAGVAVLALASGGLPWISLFLAVTFAFYGLIRKTVEVGSIAGLAVETGMLAPVAALGIALREARGEGALANAGALPAYVLPMLLTAGVVTALPLVWFASAARRLRLATVGLFQYIAPTLGLAIAVGLYGEPFTRAHAVAFACIWTALALYTAESLKAQRTSALAGAAPVSPDL